MKRRSRKKTHTKTIEPYEQHEHVLNIQFHRVGRGGPIPSCVMCNMCILYLLVWSSFIWIFSVRYHFYKVLYSFFVTSIHNMTYLMFISFVRALFSFCSLFFCRSIEPKSNLLRIFMHSPTLLYTNLSENAKLTVFCETVAVSIHWNSFWSEKKIWRFLSKCSMSSNKSHWIMDEISLEFGRFY